MLNIIWRDVLLVSLTLFVGLFSILLLRITEATQAGQIEMPGSIMATITWPEGPIDVDLWLMGPGEPVPIGYSNKGGLLWNLLRDDLGKTADTTPLNYENAFTRGMPAGEYIINAHCFTCPSGEVPVYLEIAMRRSGETSLEIIATSEITLTKQGQEKTGLVFELDEDAKVVEGSMHTVYQPLRSRPVRLN